MANRKVVFTVGVPASGKSGWATELASADEKWVRVSRDDFRYMMCGRGFTPHVETLITAAVDAAVALALENGMNVVVDATHCRLEYLRQGLAKVAHSATASFKYFPIDLDEAIVRDETRERSVGADVIRAMHANLQEWAGDFDFGAVIPPTRRSARTASRNYDPNGESAAVIFDIDGTLAIMGDRSPFDWKRVGLDAPNDPVVEMAIHHRDMGDRIVLMSGRSSACRAETEAWLDEHNVPYHELHMRKEGDSRKDSEVKLELYDRHVRDKYRVYCVYDDRPQVVEMWHGLGLFVFNVLQGNYRF